MLYPVTAISRCSKFSSPHSACRCKTLSLFHFYTVVSPLAIRYKCMGWLKMVKAGCMSEFRVVGAWDSLLFVW